MIIGEEIILSCVVSWFVRIMIYAEAPVLKECF